MKTVEEKIIHATKALLITPDKWCKMTAGHVLGGEVVARCLSRALHDAFMQQGYPTVSVQAGYERAKDAVCSSLPDAYFDIIQFNDDYKTRHSDVICVLDQAAVTVRQDRAQPVRQFDPACQAE